ESFQDALTICRAALGERHLLVATSYNNLAVAYRDLGEPARAVEYHEKALAIRRAALGERHTAVATSYNNLAIAYLGLGEPARAVEYHEKALPTSSPPPTSWSASAAATPGRAEPTRSRPPRTRSSWASESPTWPR